MTRGWRAEGIPEGGGVEVGRGLVDIAGGACAECPALDKVVIRRRRKVHVS